MGSLFALPVKIYKVVNGTEVFIKSDTIYINGSEFSSSGGLMFPSAIEARNSIGAANATLFCVEDSHAPVQFSGFRKFVLNQYDGQTIRIHIIAGDNIDRYIEFAVSIRQISNTSMIGSDCTLNLQFYKNGQFMFAPIFANRIATSYTYIPSGRCHTQSVSFPWLVSATKEGYFGTYGDFDENTETVGYTCFDEMVNANLTRWNSWLDGYVPPEVDPNNPYWDGGISGEGGGGGNFSGDSDEVTPDLLPSLDIVGTGMGTIFKPSRDQLRALADVMWNSNFFTFMQNLVENISDMFTSLAIVPFDVVAGATVNVTWLGFDTAVSLTLAAQQYYEFNMGSIDLDNDSRIYSTGSALDYSPFSRLGIFLPFIGYQELDIDECRGASINLRYRVDILSGSCVALISVGGNTIYQFTGNCLSQIPITSENMQSLVSDAVNIGIAAASARANYAVGAAMEEGASVKEAKEVGSGALEHAHAESHIANARNTLASASANAVVGMKPGFAKAGAVGASAALLAVKQPYLFLSTPRQAIPEHYQRYCGFPSNITGKLSEFSGFTVVEDIRLNGLVATSPEVAEIYELLKKGVII